MSFGGQRGHLRKYKGAGAATGNSPSIPSSLGLTSSRAFSHMRISVDSSDIIRFVKRLDALNKRGAPHAMRESLNTLAFATRKQWQREIRSELTLRNRWTVNSIRVEKARGSNIGTMEATVGSVAKYMRRTEEGETLKTRGKHGVSVPTGYASGEEGATPPQRLPTKPHRMPSIQLTRRGTGSRKQRNAVAIRKATQAGGRKKFVFLETEKKKGIFKIMGRGKRSTIKMVWDLSSRALKKKPFPTLQPALRKINPKAPRIYAAALSKQVRRALKS